jgi:predicted RNase H-like HicB family nuclease
MKKIIQVRISKGSTYFIGECLDLPVVTQGKTFDELTENLRGVIALQLEGENPADFDLAENSLVFASFEIESPREYIKT